jgi:hypothetical protein
MTTERDSRPRRGWRDWLDPFVALIALLVSAVSLWVAIGTESANRQMVAAASWPLLEQYTADTGKTISFSVLNGGVGPAKLKTFQIFWKGRPQPNSLALLTACCGYRGDASLDNIGVVTQSISGVIIRAGESHTYFSLPLQANNADLWHRLDAARRQLTFRACYCSVFDECWIGTLKDLEPQRVDRCPSMRVQYLD